MQHLVQNSTMQNVTPRGVLIIALSVSPVTRVSMEEEQNVGRDITRMVIWVRNIEETNIKF